MLIPTPAPADPTSALETLVNILAEAIADRIIASVDEAYTPPSSQDYK